MAEIQLLGMTHYPPFGWAEDKMSGLMKVILTDPDIPSEEKDPANWPKEMREEWGDDEGVSSAAQHRNQLVDGFDKIRSEIESFQPDVILIWGDDQYENFKEDIVPAFSILAYPDRHVKAYASKAAKMFPRYWDEPDDFSVEIKGRPDVARQLTADLLGDGFDIAYAYEPLHDKDLPHAFLNTVLFLDHRRQGFPWPVICMPINCYGKKVLSAQGMWKPFATKLELDPPSPPPWRLMDMGAAVVRHLRESPWRVSVIASSSWSHAFLTDHTWRLRPDTPADRELYDAMVAGDFKRWKRTTTDEIDHSGQQEVLNWFALMGAAQELGLETPNWSTFVETSVFNSNKVFAAWNPTK